MAAEKIHPYEDGKAYVEMAGMALNEGLPRYRQYNNDRDAVRAVKWSHARRFVPRVIANRLNPLFDNGVAVEELPNA